MGLIAITNKLSHCENKNNYFVSYRFLFIQHNNFFSSSKMKELVRHWN